MYVIQFYSVFILYFSHISASAGLTNSKYNPLCFIRECCNDDYIKFDRARLQKNLREQVYGQPFLDEVVNALSEHFSPYPISEKPLILSFHGMTGVGKSYVSKFIADSLFREGSKSEFVHQFIGRLHFSEEKHTALYKTNLYNWLKNNITQCPRQLFIFDEVDKIVPDVLDAIKPLLDSGEVEGVSYSEVVFIFLSNIGANIINEHYHDLYVNAGKQREELILSDFETYIQIQAFNEEGGFFRCDTIKHNLIDHYIPFLPLEEKHVVRCIEKEFELRRVTSPKREHIDEVLKYIEWGPDESKIFSKAGCRRLGPKVGLIVNEWYRHNAGKDEL